MRAGRPPVTSLDELVRLGNVLVRYQRERPLELQRIMAAMDETTLLAAERALAIVTREGWRSSPLAMAAQLDPDNIKRWSYIKLLSDKFRDAVNGVSIRQIWNLPARYGKSLFGSQWGPTWAFDANPTLNIALTSYGDKLANENALGVRNRLTAYSDVLDCQLRVDRRAGDRFVTTEGGGLIAAGIGSSLTGFGADLMVIDDPFKDWREAHSEATRLHVWNWYRSVARLRLQSGSSAIIVIMTRWHEDDLTGRLLNAQLEGDGEEWELIRLPAIAEENDQLGRAPGECLEPERFTLEECIQKANALGSYLTAGMEQQRPSPEEGGDIKRGWWKWYTERPPRFDDAITSWDCKLKDNEKGDFVVGQAWGRTGTDFWGIDQLRGQYNFTTTKVAVALLATRHPYIKRHIIENRGNGPEVMAELRRKQPGYLVSEDVRSALGMTDDEVAKVQRLIRVGIPGLLPEEPKGSKSVRARAHTGLIESGHVHVPVGAGWADALVNEAAAFPNGAHDDMVDTWAQAMKRLSAGGTTISAPHGSIKTPSPGARSTGKPATQRISAARVPRMPGRVPRRR